MFLHPGGQRAQPLENKHLGDCQGVQCAKVGLGGETALVGAYQDDDQGADSGSAYVFVRSGGAWSQQAKLLPSDGTDGDYFGYSVALAGETALVGAYQDDDQGTSSGSAYVFVRSGGAWSQQAKLLPTDGTDFYYFGHAVALAGETALVGGESVYIFERSGGAWSQQAKLLPNDGAGGAFGYSVALAGETALVGAYQDDDQGTSSGSAYVFVRSSGVWSQQAKLLPTDGAAYDYFGASVAVSDDTALIGAYGDDDQGTDSGSAYVFVRSGGSWSQQAKLLPSDGAAADLLANSVALWGEIALIGAYADDDQGGNSGSAYVFVRSGGSWSQQAKLLPSNGSSHGAFGLSVALSDGIALAGSPNNDASGSVSGFALFYDNEHPWIQAARLPGARAGAGSGRYGPEQDPPRALTPRLDLPRCRAGDCIEKGRNPSQYTSSLSSSISVLPVPRSSRAPAASASMAYAATPLAPATARHARSRRAPLPTALVRL